jgi:acyl carrier protein
MDAWNTTVGGNIGQDDEFLNSGLDSLSSVELHFAVQQGVGDELEIPENIFFSERSPASLSAWIARKRGSQGSADEVQGSGEEEYASSSSRVVPSDMLSDTQSESDDEISSEGFRSDDEEEGQTCEEDQSTDEDDTLGLSKDQALAIVNGVIQDTLGYTVDRHAPLTESGVDSLSSLEIQNSLRAKVPAGIRIPATIVFDYPTVEKMSQFLVASKQPRKQLTKGTRPGHKPAVINADAASGRRSRRSGVKTRATRHIESPNEQNQDCMSDPDDPIAIVGMASRFPGQNNDRVETWFDWLLEGQDAFIEVPHSRFDIDAVYRPGGQGLSQPGSSYVRHAAFIDSAEMFDHAFFGMSEAEASRIDPQQRLVLETSFQALHSAGYNKQQLDGQDVGVYVGCCSFDWSKMPEARGSAYSGTGAAGSILANRVSFALNLCAPSMTIDTACSSALVALDAAASALREKKCRAAVVTAGTYPH